MAFRATSAVAFRAARPVLGPYKQGASVHLEKVWGTFKHREGVVTRHLSPHEQNVFSNFFYKLPEFCASRVKETSLDAGLGFIFLVGSVGWADWYYEQLSFHHRD